MPWLIGRTALFLVSSTAAGVVIEDWFRRNVLGERKRFWEDHPELWTLIVFVIAREMYRK